MLIAYTTTSTSFSIIYSYNQEKKNRAYFYEGINEQQIAKLCIFVFTML